MTGKLLVQPREVTGRCCVQVLSETRGSIVFLIYFVLLLQNKNKEIKQTWWKLTVVMETFKHQFNMFISKTDKHAWRSIY